jgi:integrase/recombinase XerD
MLNQIIAQPTVPTNNCAAPVDRIQYWLTEFDDYMRNERGLSVATRRGRRSILNRFLGKVVAVGDSLTDLTIRDIDGFLQSLGEQGDHSRVSLQFIAGCLRVFFRYGATRGWCRNGLAEAIHSPRVYSLDTLPGGPSREDVKRLLALTEGDGRADIRDRAILMLLAVYGLRAGEVTQLRLDDFDWKGELLSVSCSKTRRTRIYPLSRPVGDAVLRYITQVRPLTNHREVFLTLLAPIRPVQALWAIVAKRLRHLGVTTPHHGPHALRHACATHLLAEGFSLKQIGDQLGHQDADSTRIYAKVDISGLRKVADVDLGGLL